MYEKETAIREVGEENWEEFEMFMLERGQEYDEDGMEIYYGSDIEDFKLTL